MAAAFKLKMQKMPAPLEREEQAAYFRWLYYVKYRSERVWDSAFMIANGGYKYVGSPEARALQGKAMAAQGLKPGVPDIFLAIPADPFNGLFIEMKRAGVRKATAAQVAWHVRLMAHGYCVRICSGLHAAQLATLSYLHLPMIRIQ